MTMWSVFIPLFGALLVADFLLTRNGAVTARKSLGMTAGYIAVGVLFGRCILSVRGSAAASQFASVFSLEQLLSVDNLLVISMIFGFFGIPKERQHKALLFGIAGAVVFRTLG